jgi:hypothetical protein
MSDIERWAAETRGILRASGAFDNASRIFGLVNALESTGRSYEVEATDLRGAVTLDTLGEIAREMYEGMELGSPEQLAVSEFLGRAESLGGSRS